MPTQKHKHLAHVSAFSSHPLVFFTVVTDGRRAVLANDHAHQVLVGLWSRSGEANGWWVGDYIIMPDHVHFFARASRKADRMQKWVQMWKSVSAHAILKDRGLSGPLWQKDYFDRYLRKAESYSQKWLYVEANPIRKGLVKQASDWPYRGQIYRLVF